MIVFQTISVVFALWVIFAEQRSPRAKIVWILMLLALPIGGIILYLFFGFSSGNTICYHYRCQMLRDKYHVSLQRHKHKKYPPGVRNDIADFLQNYGGCMMTANNKAKIYPEGDEYFALLLGEIRQAKESIDIMFYSVHNDSLGREFVRLMTEKASEGIPVRLLYDGFGSLDAPRSMYRDFRKAGGQVKKMNPYPIHFRNHHKIVVIDGRIGHVGGFNVGDKYRNMHRYKKPWRDTQLRLEGDAVLLLQYYFLVDWYYSHKKNSIEIHKHEWEMLFPENHGLVNPLPCQIVSGGPVTQDDIIRKGYLRMIASAKKSLIIQTPYFIPDNAILSAMQLAAASGVEVLLMIPTIPANPVLGYVTDHYIDKLIPYGVKIYRFNGYIHAKTLALDEEVTCIGSVNMDIRSFEIDDEIYAVLYGNEFYLQHKVVVDHDLENSTELDYHSFMNRPWHQRILEQFFHLLSPLL